MYDTAKYLIHADITAAGVVERSDVVGAIFGQTEGLLGEELDLRDLQDSSKVGRIDVEVDSEAGQSFGTVTIASGLDQVETAILAAGLETIERVGPCQASLTVQRIEDVRAAKRRQVVERAKELVRKGFGDGILTSEELIEEVRTAVRVEDITEYEGYPAGPRVDDSDAIIVVEGRSDVLQLLKYGVKNAIAVEGTNVPDEVAALTNQRTVTTFLDGDRGGELILKELDQVGRIDFVAFAPEGRSVEDLSRGEVMSALRKKVPYDQLIEDEATSETVAVADGATRPAPPAAGPETLGGADGSQSLDPASAEAEPDADASNEGVVEATAVTETVATPGQTTASEAAASDSPSTTDTDGPDVEEREQQPPAETDAGDTTAGETTTETTTDAPVPTSPETLRGHVKQVITGEMGLVRLLTDEFTVLDEGPADEAFDRVKESDPVPVAVVLDDDLTQRVLDVAAQRGVEQIVARGADAFVKQPVGVRVRTAEQLLSG